MRCDIHQAYMSCSLNERAIKDGCEYIYQSNDDVEFITRGWAQKFVKRCLVTRVVGGVMFGVWCEV